MLSFMYLHFASKIPEVSFALDNVDVNIYRHGRSLRASEAYTCVVNFFGLAGSGGIK